MTRTIYKWWHGRNLRKKIKGHPMVNKPDILEELRGLFDTWKDSQPHVAYVAIRAIDEIVKLRNPRFRQRAILTKKQNSDHA